MNAFLFHSMSREQKAVERARKAFLTGRTKSLDYRITQLKHLQRFINERQKEIAEALKKDLSKVGDPNPIWWTEELYITVKVLHICVDRASLEHLCMRLWVWRARLTRPSASWKNGQPLDPWPRTFWPSQTRCTSNPSLWGWCWSSEPGIILGLLPSSPW